MNVGSCSPRAPRPPLPRYPAWLARPAAAPLLRAPSCPAAASLSCINVGSRYTRRRSPSPARPPLLPSRPNSGLGVKSAAAEHPAAESGPRDFVSTAAVSARGPPAGFMIAAAQSRHGQRGEKPRCGRRLESLELRHRVIRVSCLSRSSLKKNAPDTPPPRHARFRSAETAGRRFRTRGASEAPFASEAALAAWRVMPSSRAPHLPASL